MAREIVFFENHFIDFYADQSEKVKEKGSWPNSVGKLNPINSRSFKSYIKLYANY